MRTVKLNNGVEMPILGFGVFQVTDLKECERSVLDAISTGYRLIDTAQSYMNEEAVGSAINNKIDKLNNHKMKKSIIALSFIFLSVYSSLAQNTNMQQEIKDLSKTKWQWMADKNVDSLAVLFHDQSKFVHMSGTWKKDEELEIIKTGSIWYKKADVHDVAVEIVDDVATVWNRITLTAVVRGSDVVTEFTVTEVYKKQEAGWKLLALTFSSVRDTHKIKH